MQDELTVKFEKLQREKQKLETEIGIETRRREEIQKSFKALGIDYKNLDEECEKIEATVRKSKKKIKRMLGEASAILESNNK